MAVQTIDCYHKVMKQGFPGCCAGHIFTSLVASLNVVGGIWQRAAVCPGHPACSSEAASTEQSMLFLRHKIWWVINQARVVEAERQQKSPLFSCSVLLSPVSVDGGSVP